MNLATDETQMKHGLREGKREDVKAGRRVVRWGMKHDLLCAYFDAYLVAHARFDVFEATFWRMMHKSIAEEIIAERASQ